jgi:hypothetical protein
VRGNYVLQLKFADDPVTELAPLSFPLMDNRLHNELRTRGPVTFAGVTLPSVVNPLWYRIQHKPSGLAGDWTPLNRSILSLPLLGKVTCHQSSGTLRIEGNQLYEIDWASNDAGRTSATDPVVPGSLASLDKCERGLCLAIDKLTPDKKLRVKVHWIDDRLFDVGFADMPVCTAP